MIEMEDNSVNLIITSPPYHDLKNYNHDSQIGLNSGSYENYIKELNSVWKECVRVLAPDGKICINTMPFSSLVTRRGLTGERLSCQLQILNDLWIVQMKCTNLVYIFGIKER